MRDHEYGDSQPARPTIETQALDRGYRGEDPYPVDRGTSDIEVPFRGNGTFSPEIVNGVSNLVNDDANVVVGPQMPLYQSEPEPTRRDPVPNPTAIRRESDSFIASYYEDVEPRFDPPVEDNHLDPVDPYASRPHTSPLPPLHANESLEQISNIDDADTNRSPAASVVSHTSHFTSVSQRGVNPRWQPVPPLDEEYFARRVPLPQPKPDSTPMDVLNGLSDFEIPRAGRRVSGTPDPRFKFPLPR
jgi:hypothetical protein